MQDDETAHATKGTLIPFTRKSENCFAWTPEQLLEDLLRAIRAGEIDPAGIIATFNEVDPVTKRTSVHTWRARVSWTEEYTYLQIAQLHCLEHQRS